jgi:hypothetical protein
MEEKLKATIDKIVQLSKQNEEFNINLRKALMVMPSAKSVLLDDERIGQIYEYCIEKIIRKQAEEFYKDFPLKSIVPNLIEDFVRMEFFRRKDCFGDFCLSLYQQIEGMTNKICESKELADITEKMWASPAYVKTQQDSPISISNRSESNYNIAMLLFSGQNKNTGQPYSVEKSRVTLQAQYAVDKMRIVVYFLGYKAMMKASDFDSYVELTGLLNNIYQCRNMNHRGNTLNQWEKETQERILPLKSFYFFKFMGVLAQYVDYIKKGIPSIPSIGEYARTLGKKKVTGINVIGKIDIKDDGKNRFKKKK